MNKIYKVVWSKVLNNWVVVSEKSSGIGKANTRSKQRGFIIASTITAATMLTSAMAQELLITNGNLNIPPSQNVDSYEVTLPNGSIDTLNGVIYNKTITGNQSVVFSAPKAGYNPTRVSSSVSVPADEVPEWLTGQTMFNTGHDDRYGRKIELTGAKNTYTGDTIIKQNAQLAVGKDAEIDHQLLGENNNLIITDYSDLTLRSKEIVKNLTFTAGDNTERMLRDEKDTDETFYPNVKDKELDPYGRFYALPNDPTGGVIHLTKDSELVVTGTTSFKGNKNFNTEISSYGGTLHLAENATFDRGNIYLADHSVGEINKNLIFSGLHSGFTVSNSTLTVNGELKKITSQEAGSDNKEGQGSFTISNSSTANFRGAVNLDSASLDIDDGNTFNHDSGYSDHDLEPNKPVTGILHYFPKNASTVHAQEDINLTGANSRFSLQGSTLNVAGSFIVKTQNAKFKALGGHLQVMGEEGLSLSTGADTVLLANTLNLSKFTVDKNSKIMSAANKFEVTGDFVLKDNVQFLDATYADGSEEYGRLHFRGDYAHHGLTFKELENVLAGKDSDFDGELTDDELKNLYYEINKIGSLTVGGSVILDKEATYKANGNVTIDDSLVLASGSQFFVHKGDATVANGGEINGIIGIDQENTFSFNGGNVEITQNQANILGTLAINGKGTALHIEDIDLSDKNNIGNISINDGAVFKAAGSSMVANLINNSELYIGSAVEGKGNGTLTVNGNYVGAGGSTIYFGNLDVSQEDYLNPLVSGHKDLLWIKGDAEGSSEVRFKEDASFTNIGQVTKEGVLLVHVEKESKLELTLAKDQRLTDGATEYDLVGRKNLDTLDAGKNSWYLSNEKYVPPKPDPAPKPDLDPKEPTPDPKPEPKPDPKPDLDPKEPTPDPKPEPKPDPKPLPVQKVYTPESAAYLANLIAANEMYTLKYHEKQYLEGYDGVWSRLKGSFTSFNTAQDHDLKSDVDMFTLHLGRDLWHDNKATAGVMAAYGYTTGSSHNHYSGKKADHSSQGLALGVYGSYEFNEQSYVDAWLQYVFMRNKVNGQNLASHKYNSKGLTASIEAGYAFEVNETFRIQPQVQFIWMGVKDSNHTDARGTTINGKSNNLQTRLGARFYSEGENYIPFAELNYIHNSKEYNVNLQGQLNSNKVTAAGSKNLYRLELGMTTKPKDQWTASGSIAFTQGSKSYRNTSVKLDLRYDF